MLHFKENMTYALEIKQNGEKTSSEYESAKAKHFYTPWWIVTGES